METPINHNYIHQKIDEIDEILNIGDDNADILIQNVTSDLSSEEQSYLLEEYKTIYFYDLDAKHRSNKYLIKFLHLNKIESI